MLRLARHWQVPLKAVMAAVLTVLISTSGMRLKYFCSAASMDEELLISYGKNLEVVNIPSDSPGHQLDFGTWSGLSNIMSVAVFRKATSSNVSVFVSDLIESGSNFSSILYAFEVPADDHTTVTDVRVVAKHSIEPPAPLQRSSNSLARTKYVNYMAYDPSTDSLFFTDSSAVFRSYPHSGITREPDTVLKSEREEIISGLALDVCSRLLYVMTQKSRAGVATLNGYNLEEGMAKTTSTIIPNVTEPRSLTAVGRHVFWMDEMTLPAMQAGSSVKRSSDKVDGFRLMGLDSETGSYKTLCFFNGSRIPYSMVAGKDYTFYWSDWHHMTVWRLNITADGCEARPAHELDSVRPMGIAVMTEDSANCKEHHKEGPDVLLPILNSGPATVTNPGDLGPEPDPCANFCLHHGDSQENGEDEVSCFVTSLDIPLCHCQTGYSGDRCQIDSCQNFCLHGGKCLRRSILPICQCPEGFEGNRCQQRKSLDRPEPVDILETPREMVSVGGHHTSMLLSVLLVLLSFVSFGLLTVVGLTVKRNWLLKEKVKTLETNQNMFNVGENNIGEPGVKKSLGRKKVFSTPRSRSRSLSFKNAKKGEDVEGDSAVGHCLENQFVKNVGELMSDINSKKSLISCPINEGVVIDLEDCCQMTICDRPCVEGTFLKATQRKKRGISTLSHDPSVIENVFSNNGCDKILLLDDNDDMM